MYLIGISFNCLNSVGEVPIEKIQQKLNYLTKKGVISALGPVTNVLHYRMKRPYSHSVLRCVL
jgi:hypothetical protein